MHSGSSPGEVAANAILRGIEYVEEECPNSVGARSIMYKNALDQIEAQSPGTKHAFFSIFLDRIRPVMEGAQEDFELRECDICGQATTGAICAFCRMWENAHRKATENPRRVQQGKDAQEPSVEKLPVQP